MRVHLASSTSVIRTLADHRACALIVRHHGLSNTHWNPKQAGFTWPLAHCLPQPSTPAPTQCCTVKIPSSLLKACTCLRNFLLWFGDWAYVTDEIKNSFPYKSLWCCGLFSVCAIGWISLLSSRVHLFDLPLLRVLPLLHPQTPGSCAHTWESVAGPLQIRGPSYRLGFLTTPRRR